MLIFRVYLNICTCNWHGPLWKFGLFSYCIYSQRPLVYKAAVDSYIWIILTYFFSSFRFVMAVVANVNNLHICSATESNILVTFSTRGLQNLLHPVSPVCITLHALSVAFIAPCIGVFTLSQLALSMFPWPTFAVTFLLRFRKASNKWLGILTALSVLETTFSIL